MQEQEAIKEARAQLKFARISARKVKIVADLVRGKNVDEALAIMKFTPKASSPILEKLLKSAIANAERSGQSSPIYKQSSGSKSNCAHASRSATPLSSRP